MGGDTIGTSLKLSWEVAFGNIEFLSGEAYFWLAIRNKVTGESWKHYTRRPMEPLNGDLLKEVTGQLRNNLQRFSPKCLNVIIRIK